jgi:hypothetical protein
MAFAAALVTLHGPETEHREYAQRAVVGAKDDELLAHNLASHFLGAESPTMSEMIGRANPTNHTTKVAKQ